MSTNTTGRNLTLWGRLPGWGKIIFLIIFVSMVSGIHRLATDRHYSRLYVRISERLAVDASTTVYLRSGSGLITPLSPLPEDRRLFSRDSGWQRIRSIVITGNMLPSPDKGDLEVRLGAGLQNTSLLQVREIQLISTEIDELKDEKKRLRFSQAWEVIVAPFRPSIFYFNDGVMNWQGDLLLVAYTVTQGVAASLILSLMVNILRLQPREWQGLTTSSGVYKVVSGVIIEVFRIPLLILMGHLCWSWFSMLSSIREAGQYICGMIAAVTLGGLILVWFRIVDRTTNEHQLMRRMVCAAGLTFLLKLCWLSNVNCIPRSDYREYFRYGSQIASGDWNAIREGPASAVAPIYLRRSLAFAAPIVWCLGPSITAFEFANVAIQALTVLMFCVLVRRVSGLRTAAFSLPWLMIYPEVWFQAGTVTHNVAGYFWIMATWLSVDSWLRRGEFRGENGSGWFKRALSTLAMGIITGICSGFVELTKSYGPIYIVGFVVVFVVGPTLLPALGCGCTAFRRAGWARWVFLTVVLVAHHLLVSQTDAFLVSRTGLRPLSGGVAALLTSVESAGPGGGEALAVWIERYFLRVPDEWRLSLTVRKLMHEKLGDSREFLWCVFKKNATMAATADALGYSQDVIAPVDAQPRVNNVYLGTFQFTVSHVILLCIGLLVFGRVLMPGPLLNSEFLLVPAVMPGLVLAVIYLAVESHPYYALNFVFPFCWLAGTTSSTLYRSGVAGEAVVGALRRVVLPWQRLAAFAVLGGSVAVYVLLGDAVDGSGLTFHRIVTAGSTSVSGGLDAPVGSGPAATATAGTSRVHGWVEFGTSAGRLRERQKIEQSFVVQSQAGPLRGVCFFVSGNQRVRHDKIRQKWRGLPVVYTVTVGTQVLFNRRPIEELTKPLFVAVPAEAWGQSSAERSDQVVVTVSLECTGDVEIGRISPPPAVAVEYFF